MFKGLQTYLPIFLILALATSGIAEAQAFGRVTVVVKNQDGKPLQGVKVTVTCDEMENYLHETETNKKGKAIVSVTDATKIYDFKFQYEDYQPAEMPIKPEVRGNITREVTMTEGQVVATEGGSVSYTPAERIFNEGVVALKDGDLETAKTKFMESMEKDSKLSAAHSALAGVHLEQKNYQAALAAIESYRQLEPESINGWFMLYDVHTALGNQDEADAALKALKAADRSGDTVALIFNAGVAAVRAANYATAKARFLEALELDPNLEAAVSALALIFHREGDYAKAAEFAEKHLTTSPGDQQSLRIRWDSYEQLGDKEKAGAAFKELAAADPKVLATEFYNKAVELFESGDSAAALVEFERVIEIQPEHARAHYQLGICHVGTGDTAAAKKHLQKFLELAPDDPEAGSAKDMLSYLE